MKAYYVCLCFLMVLLFAGVSPVYPQVASEKVDVLVIDPGHGGKDPGCVGKTTREKDVVLAVGLRFGQLVKAKYPEVKVVYTRSDDRFVELWKRGQIANDNHADLFVSIHCNAAGSSSARGYETWLRGSQKNAANLAEVQRENEVVLQEQNHEKNYSQSWLDVVTATVLQDVGFENSIYFSSELQQLYGKSVPNTPNRGIKQGPFYVLWKSARPSVLTELGFLSNPSEEKFLASKEGQEKMAQCLFKAFEKYKQRIDSRIGTSAGLLPSASGSVDNGVKPSGAGEEMTGVKEKTSEGVGKETGGSSSESSENEVVRSESAEPDFGQSAGTTSGKTVVSGSQNPTGPASPVVFKVQIAASAKKMDLKPYNFNGLKGVSLYYDKDRKLYKYYYSSSSSYKQIQQEQEKARQAGYRSAFVVAFEKGQPIPLQEAIEKLKN